METLDCLDVDESALAVLKSSGSSMEESNNSFKTPLIKAAQDEKLSSNNNVTDEKQTQGTHVQHVSASKLEYEEPSWAKVVPCDSFALEVLKNGVLLDKIALSHDKTKFLIGRLPDQCDICCEHPSCSRFHAVLQYGCMTPDTQDGFYLYDLSSTHGTIVNKFRISPLTYVRLRPNYVMKFGASTRLYILQGPDEEHDEEIVVPTVHSRTAFPAESNNTIKVEESGVDWGFGPDAVEEEKEIGFLEAAPVGLDEYYKEDPKKALNTFFLREGMDMEYDVEEVGSGHKKQFLCRIPLPLETPNGRQIIAEATVSGKKKEALAAAVLEACRILHAKGVLKGTTSIGKRNKGKNWADEDFYDSDEDTFLDRTGTVEKKRQQRIQRAGKKHMVAETYATLVEKLENNQKEITEITEKLNKADKAKSDSMGDGGLDALETFMDAIKSGLIMDPKTKIKLKQRLLELNHEEAKLKHLIEIAKPTLLPPVLTTVSTSSKSANVEVEDTKSPARVTLGRMKTVPLPPARTFNHDQTTVKTVEVEEDDQKIDSDTESQVKLQTISVPEASTSHVTQEHGKPPIKRPTQENIGIKLPEALSSTNEDVDIKPSAYSRPYIPTLKKQKLNKKKDLEVEYNTSNHDAYAMWVPPEDQAGDGVTDLNKRLGY